MKTFTARVYVRNGNAKIAHTIQFPAESSFAAQQMLSAQYGLNNVITVPTEVKGSTSTYDPAPWLKRKFLG